MKPAIILCQLICIDIVKLIIYLINVTAVTFWFESRKNGFEGKKILLREGSERVSKREREELMTKMWEKKNESDLKIS